LRRIVLVRHGETAGESSIRFHGASDVPLSLLGMRQLHDAELALRREPIDLVVASSLSRSWAGAWIVGGGRPVQIERDLCEVDFGRWEGLTREEIEARDPALYEQWQRATADFDYPDGERRADFRARVRAAADRILAARAWSVLCVLHKGVIREIVRHVAGAELARREPELGGVIRLTRPGSGAWRLS
jgi:broad specificity phosphatase PhoE